MTFNLSKPAMLAAVAYLVMAFIILIPIDGQCKANENNCYNLPKRILIVLLMLIPIGLSIYSLNCMVIGKCVVWSWINSIFIALWVLLFLIATVMSFDQRRGMVDEIYIIQ
jgi:protein-S-isoprenylcysteine O-methyltransferase Ste14